MFLTAQIGDLFMGGGPVARVLRDFHSLLCDSLASRTSSHEKHLENFSKFLS